MRFSRTPVDGAVVIELEGRSDERGFFARTFDAELFAAEGMDPSVVQCSVSFNRAAGTLRGLHRQRPPHAEGKLVRCVAGSVADVAVDVRPGSPTAGAHVVVELTASNRVALFIPPYVAHGFLTLTDDTEVMYQMSGPYVPGGGEGYRYDDPAFGITWPGPVTVISEADSSWPLLGVAVGAAHEGNEGTGPPQRSA